MEYHFLLLLPVTVLLAWMLVFAIGGRYHRLYDRLLLLLLGCSIFTCYITLRAIVDGTDDYAFIALDNLETFLGLSICPLLFLYMRTIAHNAHWQRWYWWLFAPAFLIGVVGTALSIAVGWDRILAVRGTDYLPFVPASGSAVELLYQWITVRLFNLTLEVMAVVLIIWSLYYLWCYHRHIGNYYANLEDSCVGYIYWFLAASVVLLLSVFFITVFIRHFSDDSPATLLLVSLWLSVWSWIIARNAWRIRLSERQLEDLSLEETPAVPEEPAANFAMENKIRRWISREDRPYCKEGLTVAGMADDIRVSPRALSAYINQTEKMNFNQWINRLRIEEAKRLLLTASDTKIGYVAAVCGFADQSSFSRTFRNLVGCSPQSFRDAHL